MLSNNSVVGTFTRDFKFQSLIFPVEEGNRQKPCASYMNHQTVEIM